MFRAPDEVSPGTCGRTPAKATKHHHRTAVAFAHQQAGCRRKLIGDRDDRTGKLSSVSVSRAAVIFQGVETRHANCHIYQALAPRPAERIGHHDSATTQRDT